MHRLKLPSVAMLLCLPLSGCNEEPVQQAQPAPAETGQLRLRLDNSDYRGGENEKHWHLTTWSLENKFHEAIDEAVVIVSLFDDVGRFLGHHSVTFHHMLPGESAQQSRLLYLKSDSVGSWKPRFEAVHSRARGEMSQQLELLAETDAQAL